MFIGSAVDTFLLNVDIAGDRTNLADVALDQVEVATAHELFDSFSAQRSCSSSYWIEKHWSPAQIVRLDSLDVVLCCFRSDCPHVQDKGATELREVCSLIP